MYENRNPGKSTAQAIVDTMEMNAEMTVAEIVDQTEEVDDRDDVIPILTQLLLQGQVGMTPDMKYIVPRPPAS